MKMAMMNNHLMPAKIGLYIFGTMILSVPRNQGTRDPHILCFANPTSDEENKRRRHLTSLIREKK